MFRFFLHKDPEGFLIAWRTRFLRKVSAPHYLFKDKHTRRWVGKQQQAWAKIAFFPTMMFEVMVLLLETGLLLALAGGFCYWWHDAFFAFLQGVMG